MSEGSDHLTLLRNRRPGSLEPLDEQIAHGNAYAAARGQRQAMTLEFIWEDGRSIALPYQCLPVLWNYPPDLLLIEYPGHFTIALRGKNLGPLARQIGERRILWIRECSEEAAEALPLAVTCIELMYGYFPSRAGSGFAGGKQS